MIAQKPEPIAEKQELKTPSMRERGGQANHTGLDLLIEPDQEQASCHAVNLFTNEAPGGQLAVVDCEKVWLKIRGALD